MGGVVLWVKISIVLLKSYKMVKNIRKRISGVQKSWGADFFMTITRKFFLAFKDLLHIKGECRYVKVGILLPIKERVRCS